MLKILTVLRWWTAPMVWISENIECVKSRLRKDSGEFV